MKEVIALLATMTFFVACSVGEVPAMGTPGVDAPPTDPAGEASFNMVVKPLVTTCLGIACHSGVQPPTLDSFGQLQAKYKMKPGAMNILVTKGQISVPVGTHSGIPYLDAAGEAAVAAWIDGLP